MKAKNWSEFNQKYAVFYHWLTTTNFGIFLIASFLLLFNQVIEFFIIFDLGRNYRDLCWWDCLRYSSIVETGYDGRTDVDIKSRNLNLVFFPLLPLSAKFFDSIIGIGSVMSSIVTSKVFFLFAVFAFIKFCQIYAPKVSPWIAGLVVTFSPYQIYANTGYTEAIFLLFTCLAFIFLKQNRYVASGLAGAFLSAARPSGFFFLFPYLLRCKEFIKVATEKKIEMLLGFLLIPLGLTIFMCFLYFKTGDALAASRVQDLVWHRISHNNPVSVIFNGLLGRSEESIEASLPLRYLAVTSLIAVLISLALWWQKRYELAFFSLSSSLFYLSFGLLSMPRFVWWQAPILLFIAEVVSIKRFQFLILILFFLCRIFFEISWIEKGAYLV